METFIIVVMLYFLITGLTSIGLTMTNQLPRSKKDYEPAPAWYYYAQGIVFISIALWAAAIL